LARSDDGTWAQILWQKGNAWVASRYLSETPRPRLDSGLPVQLRCGGTEPGWSLTLSDQGTVQLDLMAGSSLSAPIAWSTPSRNEDDNAYAFGAQDLTGVLRRAMCTDGATDRVYGWRMDLVSGPDSTLFSGCCSLLK